jgi:hypothetical protein
VQAGGAQRAPDGELAPAAGGTLSGDLRTFATPGTEIGARQWLDDAYAEGVRTIAKLFALDPDLAVQARGRSAGTSRRPLQSCWPSSIATAMGTSPRTKLAPSLKNMPPCSRHCWRRDCSA